MHFASTRAQVKVTEQCSYTVVAGTGKGCVGSGTGSGVEGEKGGGGTGGGGNGSDASAATATRGPLTLAAIALLTASVFVACF